MNALLFQPYSHKTAPHRTHRSIVRIGLCVVFFAVSTSEAQTIYKWEDARGILHYSDAQQTPRSKRLKQNALPSFGNNVAAAIPTAEEPATQEVLTTSTTPP